MVIEHDQRVQPRGKVFISCFGYAKSMELVPVQLGGGVLAAAKVHITDCRLHASRLSFLFSLEVWYACVKLQEKCTFDSRPVLKPWIPRDCLVDILASKTLRPPRIETVLQ